MWSNGPVCCIKATKNYYELRWTRIVSLFKQWWKKDCHFDSTCNLCTVFYQTYNRLMKYNSHTFIRYRTVKSMPEMFIKNIVWLFSHGFSLNFFFCRNIVKLSISFALLLQNLINTFLFSVLCKNSLSRKCLWIQVLWKNTPIRSCIWITVLVYRRLV